MTENSDSFLLSPIFKIKFTIFLLVSAKTGFMVLLQYLVRLLVILKRPIKNYKHINKRFIKTSRVK